MDHSSNIRTTSHRSLGKSIRRSRNNNQQQSTRIQFTMKQLTYFIPILAFILVSSLGGTPNFNSLVMAAEEPSSSNRQQQQPQATQASLDRQVDSPSAAPAPLPAASSSSKPDASSQSAAAAKAAQRLKQQVAAAAAAASASSKRAASLASQQNYDKYQLKASNSNSHHSTQSSSATATSSSPDSISKSDGGQSSGGDKAKADGDSKQQDKQSSSITSSSSSSVSGVQKKNASNNADRPKSSSSFSLFKKLLPSFMTSVGPGMAAMAGAAASAFADKHQMSHSRSSQVASSGAGESIPLLSKASGKIINLLTSATISKKLAPESLSIGSPASSGVLGAAGSSSGASTSSGSSFLSSLISASKNSLKPQPSVDRQAGGLTASSLLSNPLGLGLLFSAPLIPSLLLTPLAIAGLSPAMSAINNFLGDDDDSSSSNSNSNSLLGGLGGGSHQSHSPLAMLTGPSSPLSSILQGNPQQAAANIQSALSNAASASSGSSPSFAMQAMQTFLGPPATTEKPLFNPGLFASQGIQNAMGSLASDSSSSSSSSSGSSSSSSSSSSPIRNLFGGSGGGSLLQTAASMISPTFAAPPSSGSSSSSSSDSDNDSSPGFMQAASEVFDKVATYMNPLGVGEKNASPVNQASSSGTAPAPWTDLLGLTGGLSPFSSFLTTHPISPASGSSGAANQPHQKVGFLTTLKNFYELFSSSFLRRQETSGLSGENSNECQQRLICELHQRAMNSKLFRRSVQANLMELANLDKTLQEQIKVNPMQARVDADTKAMLNDFLKATNNFKNGRELVNCSKMFPKCSRVALLSTANAHLHDVNGNKAAFGKFSTLMKKMKFKASQQHQSQWKLRNKSNKAQQQPNGVQQQQQQQQIVAGRINGITTNNIQQQQPRYQATDYFQVAPLSPMPQAANSQSLNPVDSLKFVQQIMMMSQQPQQPMPMPSQQQQPQQPLQQPLVYNQNQQVVAGQQLQQPMASFVNYQQQQQQQQYPPASQATSNVYTDAMAPMYSNPVLATESPFYSQSQMQTQQQQHQQQMIQQQPQISNPSQTGVMSPVQSVGDLSGQQLTVPSSYQASSSSVSSYPSSSSMMPTSDAIQQQSVSNSNTAPKSKPIAIAA